ncbi:MAG: SH3 domain-containing protein [Pyrinomonadaceae bacterium]
MKIYCLIILVLTLVGAGFGQNKVVVIAKQVNVRDLPSAQGKIVFKVFKGTNLDSLLDDSKDGWYAVVNPKTKKRGWIHGNTIKILNQEKTEDGEFLTGLIDVINGRVPRSIDGWITYASSSKEIFSYNPSRTTRRNGLIQVWTKSVSSETYKETGKVQYEINCRQLRLRSLAGVKYNSGGEVYDDWDTPYSVFSSPVPESIGEALVYKICK